MGGGALIGTWQQTTVAPVGSGYWNPTFNFTTAGTDTLTYDAGGGITTTSTATAVAVGTTTPAPTFQVVPAPDEGQPGDTTAYRLYWRYPATGAPIVPGLTYDGFNAGIKNASGNYTIDYNNAGAYPNLNAAVVANPGEYDVAATSLDAAGNESATVAQGGPWYLEAAPSYSIPYFNQGGAGYLDLDVSLTDQNEFSVSYWLKINALPTAESFTFCIGALGADAKERRAYMSVLDNAWVARVYRDGTAWQYSTGPGVPSVGPAFHCVITYNLSAGLKHYINGQEQDIAQAPLGTAIGFATADKLRLFEDTYTGNVASAGDFQFGDFLMWNRQASEPEVLAWYNNGSGIAPGADAVNYNMGTPWVFFTGTDWTDGNNRGSLGAFTWVP